MSHSARVHAFRDDILGDLDATGIAELVAAGQVKPREVTEAALARVEDVASLDAVEHLDPGRALDAADRDATGVFAGVPTFVKDNVDVAGWPTGNGSEAYAAPLARTDSDFVRAWAEQGLTFLGKSRLPEFGFSATTEFMTRPPVRNPWNPAYSSGASSGGSAALVAAGAVPLAHANDGGGSIRIPAAACGLVGLKPTRGRITPDRLDLTMPVKIVAQGVVTRSVRDTARFFAAAERTYRNPKLPPVRLVERAGSTRLRVGVLYDSVIAESDRDTRLATTATAELLADLGHHVEEIPLPITQQFADDFSLYWGFLAWYLSTTGRRTLAPDFDATRTDNLTRGLADAFRRGMRRFPAAIYRLRRTERTYRAMFTTYDVVLSPVLTHTTPKLGYLSPTLDYDRLFARLQAYVGFTPLNNVTGGPAISLPLGQTRAGLPLASHFSADHGDERTLLELAYELEEARPFARIQDA
ncbi:amidase [Mumia sp. Pv 4-285]|uniref:amidase n=1 Tax=Mumia qirimensis TaxID=3234852 RepID=UPI00351D89BA